MNKNILPRHVAIIMDGNGRWAKSKDLARTQGHAEGVKRVEEIVSHARTVGIKVLTLYAFSTENWSRPEEEVSVLMRLFMSALSQKARELRSGGTCIRFIGRRQGVPGDVLKAMDDAMALEGPEPALTLNVAFNYGSRAEIVDAIKEIGRDVEERRFDIERLDEAAVGGYLYTQGQPDVDLLIRTSGEQRISNFLLWQISYAEIYFTARFWPEFTTGEFNIALDWYASRDRRYGGVRNK